MAPCSSTLAWQIPWTEEPGRLQSMGSLGVRQDWVTSLSCIGEGTGNPLQCSCLEDPRDGGAWWAAVSGVAQSRTRLKWLSSSIQRVHWGKQVGHRVGVQGVLSKGRKWFEGRLFKALDSRSWAWEWRWHRCRSRTFNWAKILKPCRIWDMSEVRKS